MLVYDDDNDDGEEMGDFREVPYNFAPMWQEDHQDDGWIRRALIVIACVAMAFGLLAYVTRLVHKTAGNVERNIHTMPVRMER